MIGIPYNPNNCIFITSQALNANQFNPNVPDTGNLTTHNMLWDTLNQSLIWVDTKTNLIALEISGGGLPFGNDTGVADAYQTAIPNATLTDGYVFELKILNTNTGASTLQINALGILPVVDSDGNAITAGTLDSDSLYLLAYNSTFNAYQLLGVARPTNLPITLDVIPKGTGTSITDGSWSFAANDIIPNVSGSNIGDDTHRIGTVFMASNIDYANDLVWKSAGVDYMTLTTGGDLGIGVVPVQKLDVLGNINVGLSNGYYLNNLKFLSGNGLNSDSIQLGRGVNGTAAPGDAYVAIGVFSYSTESGIAIGFSSTINNGTFDGIAIGRTTIVDAGVIRGVALGRNSNAKHNNAWAIGFNAVTTQDDEFNFGVVGTESKLIVNGRVGIGTAIPTARLQVKGIDNTVANYALNVTDSVGTRIMSSRNDGITFFGPRYAGISSSNIYSGGEMNFVTEQLFLYEGLSGAVIFEAKNQPLIFNTWHGTAANNEVAFAGRGAAGFESFVRTYDVTTTDTGFKTYIGSSSLAGDTNFKHCFVNGNVHIGYDEVVNSNTTKLTIRSRNALAAQNNLLLQDDVLATLLKVRNDGSINAPLIPTSGSGSPPISSVSGDLWVDTIDNTIKRVP
jgi:hypothetical protein